jgi:hypothetical protein
MRKIFAIALAALLLLAVGCACGGIAAPPLAAPITTTAAPATIPPAPAPPPRSYNGIAEGDVLPGELTFYCECAECNEGYKHASGTFFPARLSVHALRKKCRTVHSPADVFPSSRRPSPPLSSKIAPA